MARKIQGKGAFWPDGARLHISISMMWESGAEPPQFVAAQMVPQEAAGKRFLDLSSETAIQYGYREGIPRMLDMFDRRKVKVSSFMSGKGIELAPKLAKEVSDRGHECAAHGWTHTAQFHLSRDDERKHIEDGVYSVVKITGQTPVGYNCQGVRRSANTLSILQELDFLYHIDDLSRDEPFIVPVNGKPFVVVPYTHQLNDIQHYRFRFGTTGEHEKLLKEEFEALYQEARTRRRMMLISLHDELATAARVRVVERFIAWAQKHKGVVFSKKADIARWALESPLTPREAEAT
jgi:peptidoglycan/xylan/chitin deacetylase (PgdA/CDA1 family)